MGKVIWHVTMSLDGFIAGPDDAMDWVFEYSKPNAAIEEVIQMTGADDRPHHWQLPYSQKFVSRRSLVSSEAAATARSVRQ